MSSSEPFLLTGHARAVVREREIDMAWISDALRDPDWQARDRRDPSLRHALKAIDQRGGRVLRVVYDAAASPLRVVTVFFDRRERSRA